MTRIIMCGCNGAMGRMITGIVNEDASYIQQREKSAGSTLHNRI